MNKSKQAYAIVAAIVAMLPSANGAEEIRKKDAEGMVRGAPAVQPCGEILWTKTVSEHPEHYCGRPTLRDAECNAALMRHGKNLIFSNCNSTKRENICVRVSRDWGATWEEPLVLWSGAGAYSEMTILPNGDVGVIYEKGVTGDPYRSIAFAIVPREKLGL